MMIDKRLAALVGACALAGCGGKSLTVGGQTVHGKQAARDCEIARGAAHDAGSATTAEIKGIVAACDKAKL